MTLFDDVCSPCRAGHHEECSLGFTLEIPEGMDCCCDGEYTLEAHVAHMVKVARGRGGDDDDVPAGSIGGAPAKVKGDSGYIHPDAWPSSSDIGTYTDPESTGRKRVARMYKIPTGTRCEWHGLESAGGGLNPIRGCLGNPATDLHHGPDKNTLNNEKASKGIGERENVHLICSWCHNTWHAKNDPMYPEYDRVARQDEPWLPNGQWQQHDPDTEASIDDLLAEEKTRREEAKRHGKKQTGRSGASEAADPEAIYD